ncbi:hypothetical protein B0H14DRAFT_3712264 [Mycena olivaceomarginata]|nr:hypothetical protein B0H14DRAFT_3712264 [Mycena olivaceomarginata]
MVLSLAAQFPKGASLNKTLLFSSPRRKAGESYLFTDAKQTYRSDARVPTLSACLCGTSSILDPSRTSSETGSSPNAAGSLNPNDPLCRTRIENVFLGTKKYRVASCTNSSTTVMSGAPHLNASLTVMSGAEIATYLVQTDVPTHGMHNIHIHSARALSWWNSLGGGG